MRYRRSSMSAEKLYPLQMYLCNIHITHTYRINYTAPFNIIIILIKYYCCLPSCRPVAVLMPVEK
jgi:hypothetical protein